MRLEYSMFRRDQRDDPLVYPSPRLQLRRTRAISSPMKSLPRWKLSTYSRRSMFTCSAGGSARHLLVDFEHGHHQAAGIAIRLGTDKILDAAGSAAVEQRRLSKGQGKRQTRRRKGGCVNRKIVPCWQRRHDRGGASLVLSHGRQPSRGS